MAPPPKLTVSEWADRYRHLSREASAEPGRWDTSRAEYQRGIMDAISDPRCEDVVIMSSAQVGKTEIVNNLVGYHIHQDPAPILIIQPTTEMGEAWSKERLAPMLRDSPALRGRVADVRSRSSGNTLRQKSYPGGFLAIAGANSAASLASRPIRVLCCDEVDRYPASAGSEGDPVSLGSKRTATFWNRKRVLVSTPTIAGTSRIETAFESSDKRRFWVPCPHCNEMQVLRWARVRWEEEQTIDAHSYEDENGVWVHEEARQVGGPHEAAYHCVACNKPWSDAQRWGAVRLGEWRAEAPFRGVAGFHLNELYSPWRRLSETVKDFLAAKAQPDRLKTWINTALGETWQDKGDAPEWERLLERREEWPAGVVPRGVLYLTAGIDVQGGGGSADERIEVYVWGWGRGLTSWLIAREVYHGDPMQAAVWDQAHEMLSREWRWEGGGRIRVAKVGVDTGGTGGTTAAVYSHLRRLRDPRFLAMKGADRWGSAGLVSGPTWIDVTERGAKIPRGLRLWTPAVSALKAELYRRLWTKREGEAFPPGWVHLPAWAEAETIKQLVAEQLVTSKDKRGFARQEWSKLRERNEALDCAGYARAALWVAGADRQGERFWSRCEAELLRLAEDDPAPFQAPSAIHAAEQPTTSAAAPAWTPPPTPPPSRPPIAPRRRIIRSSYME